MKKFEGMLFCTDLDGTLYASDKTVSKQNLDAIEYFKAEGGRFTFITGRVPKTSQEICEVIKPNAPFGCINGAGIYDPCRQQYLWKMSLPEEGLALAREVEERFPGMGIQFNTERDVIFMRDNEAMVNFRRVTGLPNLTRRYEEIDEPVLKVVFGHEEGEQIELLQRFLNEHPNADAVDFIRSERILYEILPKGVSKGVLLCKLAELLGIDEGKTIAVGDYYNDISMIRSAGLGFAVANAVEDAKAAADCVTVGNNDHAIAAIIDGLDKGIYKI